MKLWPAKKSTEPVATQLKSEPVKADAAKADRSSASAKPTYQKPTLRRYDQIDQVKTYGPSEL